MEVLNLQDQGYHLFIKGKVGNHSLRMLIDTGASQTVFDSNFISAQFPELLLEANDQPVTGAGSNSIQSDFTDIKNLQLGTLTIPSYRIAVMDLRHVNETYRLLELNEIHGVIGCDLLVKFSAVINVKKQLIKLRMS